MEQTRAEGAGKQAWRLDRGGGSLALCLLLASEFPHGDRAAPGPGVQALLEAHHNHTVQRGTWALASHLPCPHLPQQTPTSPLRLSQVSPPPGSLP